MKILLIITYFIWTQPESVVIPLDNITECQAATPMIEQQITYTLNKVPRYANFDVTDLGFISTCQQISK